MSHLTEVPTEDMLHFQDFPAVHNPEPFTNEVTVSVQQPPPQQNPPPEPNNTNPEQTQKSFWTLDYYQKFFDVDTKDVVERIIASVTPVTHNALKHHIREKPDLYGPFWICVTLIFTIAISGNIADYLQYANVNYKWKYNFHLVSYAATAICLYVTLVPFGLWCLLKWSSAVSDLELMENEAMPGVLELICIYGYSLFIYIPVSVLWSIQINWIQWVLVLIAAMVSGLVLLITLTPAFKMSRHKLFLSFGILACHLLLGAAFMLFFFHVPSHSQEPIITPAVNGSNKI